MTVDNLRWCSNCLTMSTRPRITFDARGWCNACVWTEKKKTLDWDARQIELVKLLEKHRRNDGQFDCLVPLSGGKYIVLQPNLKSVADLFLKSK